MQGISVGAAVRQHDHIRQQCSQPGGHGFRNGGRALDIHAAAKWSIPNPESAAEEHQLHYQHVQLAALLQPNCQCCRH